jgi:2',3'-cyclic-nucleotide 2'-phosphodiesterase (5'-nucleotidase family)
MRRLFIGFSIVLLLFSCSRSLYVHQIGATNVMVKQENTVDDSLVQSVIRPYRDSIEHDMAKLVAMSETPLKRGKPESKLTNLVSDILLEKGTEYCKSANLPIEPVVSYMNYGGLRGSLPQGRITVGNLFELMPFENEVVIIQISGDAVQKMAEKIAARGGEGVAGISLGISNTKVGSLKIGGENVDPVKTYWLVTSDYIANGGDQMSMFLNPQDRINTKLKLRDVLIKALNDRYKREGIISVKEDGRIFNEQ